MPVVLAGLIALCALMRAGEGFAGAKEGRAATLLETATKALAEKQLDRAYEAAVASYRLKPVAEALYRLGLIAFGQGRTIEAQDLLRRYLADPQSAEASLVPLTAEAKRILALPQPPAGEVKLFGARGSLVFLDEKLVGSLPLAQSLLCSGGPHRIALEQGKRRMLGKVAVRPGHIAEMRFNSETRAVLVTLLPAVLLVQETADKQAAARFEQAAAQATQADNYVVFRTDVALALANKPASCLREAACLSEVAQRSGAQYALRLRARSEESGGGTQWSFAASFLDPTISIIGAEAERSCERCSPEQLDAAVGEVVHKVLAQGIARPRGTLVIRTTPPGADLREGGQLLGRTPYQRAAYAGPHQLSLQLDGYEPQEVALSVEPGQTASREAALKEIPEPAPAPLVLPKEPPKPRYLAEYRAITVQQPRPRWRLALGTTALIAGAGLIGLGISALTLDGRCVDQPLATDGACREIFRTQAASIGMIGGGALLGIGGVILIAVPGGRRSADEFVQRIVPATAGVP